MAMQTEGMLVRRGNEGCYVYPALPCVNGAADTAVLGDGVASKVLFGGPDDAGSFDFPLVGNQRLGAPFGACMMSVPDISTIRQRCGLQPGATHTQLLIRHGGEDDLLVAVRNANTWAEVLRTLKSAAESVLELHLRGYVHLDLKAQNFVYSSARRAVTLVDLDSPLMVPSDQSGGVRFIVKTVNSIKSVGHISPEQMAIDEYVAPQDSDGDDDDDDEFEDEVLDMVAAAAIASSIFSSAADLEEVTGTAFKFDVYSFGRMVTGLTEVYARDHVSDTPEPRAIHRLLKAIGQMCTETGDLSTARRMADSLRNRVSMRDVVREFEDALETLAS